MEENNVEPILKLDLGINGVLLFHSEAEIEEWITNQCSFYSPILNFKTSNTGLIEIIRFIRHELNALQANLIELKRSVTAGSKDRYFDIKSYIATVFSPSQFPTRESPRGKIIAKLLASENIVGAVYGLAYLLSRPLQLQNAEGTKGFFDVVLADLGFHNRHQAVSDSLDALFNDWSLKLAEARQIELKLKQDHSREIEEQHKTVESCKSQIEKSLTDTIEKLTAKLSDAETQLSKKLLDAETRLAAVEKTYDEKLALQSAVKYWETKAKDHRLWSIIWGVLSGSVAIVATYLVFTKVTVAFAGTKLMEAQLSQVTEFALIALFGVWFMRVLVRLMLSNVHLHTDALERRTMMLTYLAMMREGQLPEGNSRDLILQALFRPTSTGIIKDDASPPFMAEWLKCTVGKD